MSPHPPFKDVNSAGQTGGRWAQHWGSLSLPVVNLLSNPHSSCIPPSLLLCFCIVKGQNKNSLFVTGRSLTEKLGILPFDPIFILGLFYLIASPCIFCVSPFSCVSSIECYPWAHGGRLMLFLPLPLRIFL